MTKREASRRGRYRKAVKPETTKAKERKPKPGAADYSSLNSPPVVREDVTERELALLGIVRHFKELGFDLSAYSSLIFGGEELCRSPEDRIAGELASTDAETFDRLLKDGVNFASVPRLMTYFLIQFPYQDAKRQKSWKKKFFAGWGPKKFRRRCLALTVLNLKAAHTMGEIQEMHDRLARGGEARSAEERLLKKSAILGARVEALLDEARGALGARTNPKRPRA